MNTGNFTFLCRTKIGFGMNGLEHLPFDLASMGSQKPLVLLDKDAQLGGCTRTLARTFKESGMTLGICPPLHGDPDTGADRQTLKKFYHLYTDKGFDAIIALGTGRVVDLAKALNIAVTLGPDTLKIAGDLPRITQPLAPFAYIPTGMGTGMETHKIARFNNRDFSSRFLAPDLAIIDPEILTQDTSDTLINAGLTCLSACCEAHVLSGNPPARAYCATGIGLLMENFLPLVTIRADFKNTQDKPRDKRTALSHLARLAHASVITGIIAANCEGLLSIQLGRHLANHCTASPGKAMALLVPAILDLMADRTALGKLALPLSGTEEFSSVPLAQRPSWAIQKIQAILNELYRITLGATPRTLDDIHLDDTGLDTTLFSDPEQARAIFAHTLVPYSGVKER